MIRARLLPLLLPLLVLLAAPLPAREIPDDGRIVILGFDGADAKLTEQLLDEGALPNLARLRDEGAYRPLGTTTPPQTPVSWSSFSTGRNPGRNGIFDFLRRDLATYQPDFAMFRISSEPFLWGKNNHRLVALVLVALSLVIGVMSGLLTRRMKRQLLVSLGFGVLLGAGALVFAKDVLPYRRPVVENTRQGSTFWEVAGEAGIPATIVRVPATWPPQEFGHGHILSGLGTPDIRGTNGTFTLYTTASGLGQAKGGDSEGGGKILQVSLVNGEGESVIPGPRNRLFDAPPEIQPRITFALDRDASPPAVTVTTPTEVRTVELGTWSDWVPMEFRFSPLIKAYGMARFYLVSADPFTLYMSPINMDPHRPPLPVSAPPAFSGELADRFGLYKTVGWGMQNMALREDYIDESAFLADTYFTEDRFREILLGTLDARESRLVVQVFELTDRVSHMFWRLIDEEHPLYDAELAAEYGDAIRDSYVFMDGVVGEALDRLGPNDRLLVVSDHGFQTWHKSVNYNTWLVRNGFMTLKRDADDPEKTLEDLFGQGEFWPNVDWKRTKAYALGLGDIYLNVKGREAQGIVEPGEEYDRIREDLITKLLAFRDPETGLAPVSAVHRREEIYAGYDEDVIPDLLVANAPKYRVSWQTALGGIPPELLTVVDDKWSGDHCSLDASITKGIFFANRPIGDPEVDILDIHPTVLGWLGLPVADDVDGKALTETD